MNTTTFDLLVIGGGSGGLAIAEKAAEFGKKVAIIEKYKLGGTCVNNGCVPKKVMWYAANLAHAVDDAPDFGIAVKRSEVDWQKLVNGRENYIANINKFWDGYVNDLNITHIEGFGHFVDNKTVEVDGQHYSAEHIVIATGGAPIVPPVPGAELGITSDGFFELQQKPERVAVIGGGYIGVELAGVLRAFGTEVTLVTLDERILNLFDPMISDILHKEMIKQGIKVLTDFQVTGLTQTDSEITVNSPDVQLEHFDKVIWAVGRYANTRNLNLDATDINVQKNGVIDVDEFENTSVKGIYAIGDITGRPQQIGRAHV